ncbi:MAG TPA: hypothetical protein VE010_10940 [Thermoanaerobaculia bacterium]|nr:hypothetical protein [Thermoanaerobaculia bacterium]
MKIRWLALIVAMTLPIVAAAGIRCDFTTSFTSPEYSYSGVLAIEGEHSRIDVVEGSHPLFKKNTSIITRSAGSEIIILDHDRRTWHARKSARLGGHLSTSRGLGVTTAARPQLRTTRNGNEHRLHVAYALTMEIEGEKMNANVELEVISELAGGKLQRALPWGLQFGAKSGFGPVDHAISRALPRDLPLRQTVSASRQIEGGPVTKETMTTLLTNVVDAATPQEVFFPPKDYFFEVPKFEFGTGR